MSVLTVTLGRTDRFDFQALQSDGATPRNISACAVLFGVKLTTDGDLLIGAGPGAGVILTEPTIGKFAVILSAAAKIGLTALPAYFWDVLVVASDGDATTPPGLSGTLEVNESITPISLASTMQPPASISYHPEITALVGGGSTDLNGYDTTTLSRPCIFVLRIDGQRQEWEAKTKPADQEADDTDTVAAADLKWLLPVGHDPVTNNVIWERIS